MYSSYEQLAKEPFYPVSHLETGGTVRVDLPKETMRPSAPPRDGMVGGILEALKHSPVVGEDGKLDSRHLLLLGVTALLFLEDSDSESDLVILLAAMFLMGM